MNHEAYETFGLKVFDPALKDLQEENAILRQEIRVSRKAAELTANLVAKQFEETEKILCRFQSANAQRKAVLDSAAQISIISTDREGKIIVFNRGAENLLGSALRRSSAKRRRRFHVGARIEAASRSVQTPDGGDSAGRA